MFPTKGKPGGVPKAPGAPRPGSKKIPPQEVPGVVAALRKPKKPAGPPPEAPPGAGIPPEY